MTNNNPIPESLDLLLTDVAQLIADDWSVMKTPLKDRMEKEKQPWIGTAVKILAKLNYSGRCEIKKGLGGATEYSTNKVVTFNGLQD